MNVLALCAGIGGIELGLKLACPSSRTVCYVEREAFSAALLVQRMEEGHLDPAPIWSDLKTFDAGRWRGVVDLVTGGYPCQPFSVAGKRKGEDDPRHLRPSVARIVEQCEPQAVFFENVPGHLSKGLDAVLLSLDALGFDTEWSIFSAAGSGAPQVRKRLFIYGAHRDRYLADPRRMREHRAGGSEAADAGATREDLADPHHQGQLQQEGPIGSERGRDRDGSGHVGDANHPRLQGRGEPRRSDGHSGQWPPWPPGPEGDWAGVPEAFHPAQCNVCGVAAGLPNRVDRLRALGNAVVPTVAARAFAVLSERLR